MTIGDSILGGFHLFEALATKLVTGDEIAMNQMESVLEECRVVLDSEITIEKHLDAKEAEMTQNPNEIISSENYSHRARYSRLCKIGASPSLINNLAIREGVKLRLRRNLLRDLFSLDEEKIEEITNGGMVQND